MWPFSKSFEPITFIPDGEWTVAVVEIGGNRHFLRINEWAKGIRRHPDYAWRLGIAAPIVDGFDFSTINEDASPYVKLEDRAAKVLRAGCESIPVLIITGPTFREWVYHTRNVESARVKAQAICDEFENLQAAYVAEHDPRWKAAGRLCGW